MWTRGGRELVYRKGDSVMAVSIDLEHGPERCSRRRCSRGPYPDNPGWTRPRSYDVSRDGERFLMTKLPAEPAAAADRGGAELVRRAPGEGAEVNDRESPLIIRPRRPP